MHCPALHCHFGWSSGCVNMNAPLSNSTILEQHAVTKFLGEEEVKPTDIHWRMLAHNGSFNCMTLWKVYKWIATIKSGRTNMSSEAPDSPWQKKLMCPLAKKLANLYLGYEGAYFGTLKDKGQTVHSATYSTVCKEKLKLTFTTKEEDCYKNCSLARQQWPPSRHSRNNRENMKPQVWRSATSTFWFQTYAMWLQAFNTFTEALCVCWFGSDYEMVRTSIWEQPKTF